METSSSILNELKCVTDESDSDSTASLVLADSKRETSLLTDIEIPLEDESSGENNEIILAVYWKRGKLGAAYYSCSNAELHLLSDVVDVRPDFNHLKTLISQTTPSQVLTSGGLLEEFSQTLSNLVNGESTNAVDSDAPRKLFFMSTRKKELSYDSCKRYILGLKLGFEPQYLNEEDHILFMHSHIDLSQESMVISLGILVKYLEKYLSKVNLNHNVFQITFLTYISLNNLVSIDDNTYKALQIFNPKVHPSAFKRTAAGSKREGLSLFGIFNRCKSSAGNKRLKEILTNPMKNVEEINDRLDAVEFCCKPQHQHIVQNLIDCMKRVESVTGTLASIYRARANAGHWKSLYKSLYNAILIGEICQKHSSHSKLLEKVAKSITENIHEVTHYINEVVDFEESTKKNRFSVRSGIDSKLDLLRQTYAQIPDVLEKVAEIELRDLPTFVDQCSVIFVTELGFFLSVPIWSGDGTRASEYALPDFELMFVVNDCAHYKTPRCVELDNVLGDSVAAMSNIESKIMITLIQFIHSRITDIVNAFRLIADLDCIISLATVALENNYCRPKLTEERELEIVQGRHPLQELCVDNFVPNDTKIGLEDGLVKILTGPNASGKSVYLKQVALIAYLAHIGSFVPAQSAIIPVLDFITTRIQSTESISTRLSAFLIDLKQMSFALYNSSPRSLVIIDEFGKGTTEIDGLSLLAASLLNFIDRKEHCPIVLVSTHFHRLTSLLPSTKLLHLQYMDYLIENDEIIYLYKTKDGSSGVSLTLLAAKRAGLIDDTMNRSLEILNENIPLQPNPTLEITKLMAKEIFYMKKIFNLIRKQQGTT